MDDPLIGQPAVYQVKVTLEGIEPAVWRRFQLRSDVTFYDLHLALQAVMGWKNYHLYHFNVAGVELSDPVTAAEFGTKNAEQVRLDRHLNGEAVSFLYEYDFCDNWRHKVVVEQQLPLSSDVGYPLCLAGERACPPENSGGSTTYAALVQATAEPAQGERDEVLALPGGRFNPAAFDVDEINLALQALR